jgi:beta-glucosidase/6-phospho-beta-glucosidase/beta-galactosidase
MEFLTGFESTYLPGHDIDVLALTRHDIRWRDDLRLVRDAGIRRLRYPIPWHRIERSRGQYDWAWADVTLEGLRELGLSPIVDPLHHTSFPRWLADGFLDPAFPAVYAAFCAAIAARYPWVREYTVFNEPLPTALLCTEFGVWPPARREPGSFWRMARNVARAICLATEAIRAEQPAARFIHVDTAEGHGALDGESEPFARHLNDRRFLFHDLILGRVDTAHPLWPYLRDEGAMAAGDLAWIREHAARIDVLGLDYYAHCEHQFHRHGATCPSRAPRGFAALARQYHERYGLPLMLTETNIRGYVSDRISWLKHMVEQCEAVIAGGIPLEGFTWFPFIDSTDWDTLLNVPRGNVLAERAQPGAPPLRADRPLSGPGARRPPRGRPPGLPLAGARHRTPGGLAAVLGRMGLAGAGAGGTATVGAPGRADGRRYAFRRGLGRGPAGREPGAGHRTVARSDAAAMGVARAWQYDIPNAGGRVSGHPGRQFTSSGGLAAHSCATTWCRSPRSPRISCSSSARWRSRWPRSAPTIRCARSATRLCRRCPARRAT